MFTEFLEYFQKNIEYKKLDTPYNSFLYYLGGMNFGDGVFRTFSNKNVKYWEQNVTNAYPDFKDQFKLFGFDWLGRCFGVDLRDDKQGILMFEIGMNDVLEIPCSFLEFINHEIIVYDDACIATNFYLEWLDYSGKQVEYRRCIGYKVPLFLGGKDSINNLEDSDMDVYWHLMSQIK